MLSCLSSLSFPMADDNRVHVKLLCTPHISCIFGKIEKTKWELSHKKLIEEKTNKKNIFENELKNHDTGDLKHFYNILPTDRSEYIFLLENAPSLIFFFSSYHKRRFFFLIFFYA